MRLFPDFTHAIQDAKDRFHNATLVHSEKWQGMIIKDKPEMAMWEVLNHSFQVPIILSTQKREDDPDFNFTINKYTHDIQPNLPWADDHFEERVCGQPINPGKTWEYWPYARSAAGHLDNGGKFNHNYMERYWPKHAGNVHNPTQTADEYANFLSNAQEYLKVKGHFGIYHNYGDLNDLVALLVKEPTTRQAYMPVFFPEDTGAVHGGRLPCSIGYHFIQRGGYCHIVYQLRSCDFVRHFRDDIYLTLRLLLWVIRRAADSSEYWTNVRPGLFTMHITSLHVFRNDYINLFGREPLR